MSVDIPDIRNEHILFWKEYYSWVLYPVLCIAVVVWFVVAARRKQLKKLLSVFLRLAVLLFLLFEIATFKDKAGDCITAMLAGHYRESITDCVRSEYYKNFWE